MAVAAERVRSIMGDSSPETSPVTSTFSRSWSGSSSSTVITDASAESFPVRRAILKKPSLPRFYKAVASHSVSSKGSSSKSSSSKSPRSDKFSLDDDLPSPLRPRFKAEAFSPDLYDAVFAYLEAARRLDSPHAFAEDLQALALTSRSWSYAAHPRLYHTIYLRLADLQSSQAAKWFSSKPKSRLKSLRATLRNSPWRSRLVRRIVVTDGAHFADLDDSVQRMALDNLATLVDACPLLEQLSGLNPVYKHEYTRFDHVLSTRQHLKSHVWTIGPNDELWNGEELSPLETHLHPTPIPEQVDHFVSLHSRWASLSTLVINGRPDANMAHDRLLPFAFLALPALRHLSISNFLDSDFDDTHLFFLPKTLASLRLEKLPGVTETGIQKYLTQTLSPESRWTFRSLSLLDMVIHRTAFLSYTLPFLPSLERLAIRTPYLSVAQDFVLEPELPPVLSSPSLKYLSWDLRADDDKDHQHLNNVTETNRLLADCIYRDGFPSIRSVFVPLDPNGIVQRVCRPLVPRNAMEIPHDESGGHALAAYMRAAQALGFAVPVATTRPSISDDRNNDAFLAIECSDEQGNVIGRWEAPRFFGRAAGPTVPVYDLRGWVEESADIMKEDAWGTDLSRFWRGRTGDRRKFKVVRKGASIGSRRSSLMPSPRSLEFPRY